MSQLEGTMQPPVNQLEKGPIGNKKIMAITLGAFGVFLILILTALVAWLAWENQNLKKEVSVLSSVRSTPAASTPDEPASDWQSYSNSTLGIKFVLPNEFAKYGALSEKIIPSSEGGECFCLTFPSAQGFLVKEVLAGGAINIFGLGTTSVDFQAGREGGFTDIQGFREADGRYFALWVGGGEIEISDNLVTESKSDFGVRYLKIHGLSMTEEPFFPIPGTPGDGYIGALINLPTPGKYRGFVIEMELRDDLTEAVFDEVLASLEYTN